MTYLGKNAFIKDITREIKNTYDRFLGIFVIIALGVSFFAGIGSTGTRMKTAQNDYFVAQNLMDIRVVSTMGLNKNDIAAIEGTEGVLSVYPSFNIDALVSNNGNTLLLKVHSIDINLDIKKRVNEPSLISGRMPETVNEAVVEPALLKKLNIELGDTITLESGKKKDIRDSLKNQRYKIVGTVNSPYYISTERGTGGIGSGKIDCFIMIPQENFYQKVYSEAFLTVVGAKDIMCFSEEYMAVIDKVTDRLKELEPVRAKERAAEMTQKAYENINSSQNRLLTKQAEAEAAFGETEAALEAYKAQIESAAAELSQARGKAVQGLRDLTNIREKLCSGLLETEVGLDTINDAKIELKKNITELDTAITVYKNGSAEYEAVYAARERLYESLNEIDTTEWDLERQREYLVDSIRETDAGKKELEASLLSITESEKQITENRLGYAESFMEFEEAKKSSVQEIEEAKKALLQAREQLNDISEPEWYVLDRESNAGFLAYREDTDKIEAIGRIFPLFFFIVAALICLTTMTRLVEERRTEIGTLKALGYGNLQIQSKYIIYAAIPTLLGGLAGGYAGMLVFPDIIITAYKNLYNIPGGRIVLNYSLWAIGILLGVFSTITAAVSTCSNEMRETPANLLRPKTPKLGKKTIFESFTLLWRSLTFIQKVTVRNIVRYKKRFFMTVSGIGGCTALLLAGFGIKNSIAGLIDKQFNRVLAYDMKVTFEDSAGIKDIEGVYGLLSVNPVIRGSAASHEKLIDACKSDGRPEKVTLIVPEETEELNRYIGLRERASQTPLYVRENGVIINEKLSVLLGISVGEEITLKDGDDKLIKIKISGICENYFNNFVFMHKDTYKELFGEEPHYNSVYTLLDSGATSLETASLANSILDKKKVSSVNFMESQQRQLDGVISSLNTVVIVIVVCAGALAFVVLYNLTNINISERIRELATIEVLGFRDKEVEAYVYRENVILTVVGILIGYILGYLLHLYIIRSVESRLMMFSREIWLSSYLYAMLITFGFSFGVNKITSIKLKKINMVEALKSVE